MAIDNGDWTTAMLLWPTADPLAGEEFGGAVDEMTAVYKYKKALNELRTKHRAPGQHGEEEDDEDKPANPKKNGKKGGGRGRGAGGAGDKQGQ